MAQNQNVNNPCFLRYTVSICKVQYDMYYFKFILYSLVDVSVLILVCTVQVHIVVWWIRSKSPRQGNTNSGNSLQVVLFIVGTLPSPLNPLTVKLFANMMNVNDRFKS